MTALFYFFVLLSSAFLIFIIVFILFLFGYRLRGRNWLRDMEDKVLLKALPEIEKTYAEDLQRMQKEKDELNDLIESQDKTIARMRKEQSRERDLVENYFTELFDDLNTKEAVERFKGKAHIRNYILSYIQKFLNDYKSADITD